jgi:Glycosyltransferase Family 4
MPREAPDTAAGTAGKSLCVLITNNTLVGRGGSELYVRDVALGLLRRGHRPVAYSTELGEVASELRAKTVAVIDRLEALSVVPDVIHGHHHLDTMTALLHFPDTPAVSFCHGWLPWQEAPPIFSRVLRYVAVDDLCRERLLLEHGIPEERVTVQYNFVDLARFKPRGPLPAIPKRALVFSNHASEETHLPVVREACAGLGLEVDVVGIGSGRPTAAPESLLGEYDIVFAKGRAALEALAVGTPVVLCDVWGVGPMVSTSELEPLRRLNFGIRTLRSPLAAETIRREIARYDPPDAAAVSDLVRAQAGLDESLERIVGLYHAAIHEHRARPPLDRGVELRSASAYLRSIAPLMKAYETAQGQAAHARQEADLARGEADEARAALQAIESSRAWRAVRRYRALKARILSLSRPRRP